MQKPLSQVHEGHLCSEQLISGLGNFTRDKANSCQTFKTNPPPLSLSVSPNTFPREFFATAHSVLVTVYPRQKGGGWQPQPLPKHTDVSPKQAMQSVLGLVWQGGLPQWPLQAVWEGEGSSQPLHTLSAKLKAGHYLVQT